MTVPLRSSTQKYPAPMLEAPGDRSLTFSFYPKREGKPGSGIAGQWYL